jgi:hypothetical protein
MEIIIDSGSKPLKFSLLYFGSRFAKWFCNMKLKAATLAFFIASAMSTQALQYEIGTGSTVEANSTDPGLVVGTSLSSTLSGTTFNLNDGGSTTFNFFKIWADEGSVNSDDLTQLPITATLDFLTPTIGAVVEGVTFGATVIWGMGDHGVLKWDAPVTVAVADRTFEVALNDVIFSKGLFDLSNDSSWVKATVTQISSSAAASVPDGGATMLLLGVGIAALGVFRRVQK